MVTHTIYIYIYIYTQTYMLFPPSACAQDGEHRADGGGRPAYAIMLVHTCMIYTLHTQ